MLLAVGACTGDDTPVDSDTDEVVAVPICEQLRLPEVAFDTGAGGLHRDDLAADFTVPLVGGGSFDLQDDWTGCDAIVVLTQRQPLSADDARSVWMTGVSELIARSPENARYLFVPVGVFGDAATALTDPLQADIEASLAALDADDAVWWRDRLLVSASEGTGLDGWVGELLGTDRGAYGFAIDRDQRIRGIGSLAAADAPATNDGLREARLYAAALEVESFNGHAKWWSDVDALAVTDVVVFDEVAITDTATVTVELPDAATMAGFETAWVEVELRCADPDAREQDSCPASTDLAQLWWVDDGDGGDVEAIRVMTPHSREGRYLVEAFHLLPFLAGGGSHTFRFARRGAGTTTSLTASVTVRLGASSYRGRAVRTQRLWSGGKIDASFNERQPAISVTRDASEREVEFVQPATGHGNETAGCAELCPLSFEFGLGDANMGWQFGGESLGAPSCPESVANGQVTPNQGGDWWMARAGWCRGSPVPQDGTPVTVNLPAGVPVDMTFSLMVNGREPEDGEYGFVEVGGYLVFFE